MKFKTAIFTIAWITLAHFFTYAQQNLTLRGKIISTDGKAIDGATVYLFNAVDSALLKTAITDAAGSYLFEKLAAGKYRLRVIMIGYQNFKTGDFDLNQDQIFSTITLSASQVTLKEVNVNAIRPFVQQKIDRTVVNPESLLSNAGNTALEVLEKSPGVSIDQSGAISLKGQGVTIFIDDKPVYLTGSDLESYLRSLPSGSIDQIELMPNPPARYDAAGNGGVINIRTRRTKLKGFNGGINLSATQGKYTKTVNSFNFNYRAGQLNLFGTLAFNLTKAFTDLTINRRFEDQLGNVKANFIQQSYSKSPGNNNLAKIGADYYLSENSTVGLNISGIYNPYRKLADVNSRFSNAQHLTDSTVIAHNLQDQLFKNGSVNLNYRQKLNKNGSELIADVDYLAYQTNNDQEFNNSSYFPDGSLKINDLLKGKLPANIDILSAKTDFEHPFKDGLKLSAGLKSSLTKTDNIADYTYTTGGVSVIDYNKTNHFRYRENINAAYLNATKDLEKFSVQLGLRLENTISDGHQLGNLKKPDSTFSRTYTDLFPTIYLQYKLDTAEMNVLSINYGRRIDRPYYQNLNPFVSPIDKFTYYTGNPFLKPSFTNNIEVSHTYKHRITTTLSYSKTLDDVNETIEIVNGIYYSRPGNIGVITVKTLELNANLDLLKWLNLNFYGRLANIHSVSDFYTGLLDTQGTYVFIRPVFQVKLKKDWTLQLDGSYQSKLRSAQFDLGARGMINLAASKKISAKSNLKLVVNDLFYTFKNSGVINNLFQTKADWVNLSDTRTIVLSFGYRFGKTIAGQRKHNADGAAEEQNRVKN